MTKFLSKRTINAPISLVFKTIADINNFSKAVPHIIKVEFLSDIKSGVGTRFRETRIMNGKEAATELEVIEYVENKHIRIVSDTHGTLWDTIFTVSAVNGQTELELRMDAKAHNFAANLMNKVIKGMVSKALEKDMNAVKAYCEK